MIRCIYAACMLHIRGMHVAYAACMLHILLHIRCISVACYVGRHIAMACYMSYAMLHDMLRDMSHGMLHGMLNDVMMLYGMVCGMVCGRVCGMCAWHVICPVRTSCVGTDTKLRACFDPMFVAT